MLFKVRQELGISEMLQSRRVVSHDILLSWEEMGEVAVAVEALVIAGKPTQCSCHSVARDSALADPRDSRGVVGEVFDRGVLEWEEFAHDVYLSEEGGMLQVAVGHYAVRVVRGSESSLDFGWKWGPPDVRFAVGSVEDTTHPRFRGVRGTQQGGVLRHDFSKSRGAMAETGGQSSERVQAVAHKAVDADAVLACLVLGPLQCAEQSSGSRYGNRDEAQFS